jgi:hypothetical protein
MRRFNTLDMLIFAACLLIGTALIGLGMAYVVQLKQRILPAAVGAPAGNRPIVDLDQAKTPAGPKSSQRSVLAEFLP